MSLKSRVERWHVKKAAKALMAGFGYSGVSGASSSFGWDGAKIRGALRSAYGAQKTLDHSALRERSREAFWDSTHGGALLQRLVDNVIGTGLKLEYAPIWELVSSPMDDEAKRKFCREVELKWYAWASSHEPDATGRRNLDELQGFAFMNALRDGEVPTALRYDGDAQRVCPLNLQFYDPDQIVTPYDTPTIDAAKSRGNEIHDGVEVTSSGKPVAIYIQADYASKPVRFPMRGDIRQLFLLPALLDLPGQVRGTGILGPVLHDLQKLSDYELFELEAALLNAIIAVYIAPSAESDTRTNIASVMGGGVKSRSGSVGSESTAETGGETRIRQAGLFVGNLKRGEDIKSFDTKRPNVNFDAFVSSITKYLSARLSVPIEALEMAFKNNYSASRASLIMFWQTVERWRVFFKSQWLQPVFEAWFGEMVARKEIKAPGYGDTPLQTRAWLATNWIGQSMPSIDPLKDANADDVRIAQGSTTRERVAQEYNGSDFYDNRKKQDAERNAMPKPEPVQAPAFRKTEAPEKGDEEKSDEEEIEE